MITFEPHRLLPGGVLQTIFGSLCAGSIIIPEMKPLWVNVSSGSPILLKKFLHENITRPIVMLAHGMGGCVESGYMKRIASKITKKNSVYMMNHRGSGCSEGKDDHLWNGGSTDDFEEVVKFISNQHTKNDLFLIGFSLSGNILLKYLGGNCEIPKNVKGAFAVNPPIDLRVSSEILSKDPSCKIFNRYFLKRLHRQTKAIEKNYPKSVLLKKRVKNILEFDSAYTVPSSGFKNLEEYYSQCSAKKHLKHIQVPTTILSSQDDPFIPSHVFEETPMSSSINCHIVNGGGHMGYISNTKTPWNDHRWMDFAIAHWIENQMIPDVLS